MIPIIVAADVIGKFIVEIMRYIRLPLFIILPPHIAIHQYIASSSNFILIFLLELGYLTVSFGICLLQKARSLYNSTDR